MFKIVVHANLLFAIDIDCNVLPRIAYKSLCIANTMRRVYIHYVMCTYVHIYISRKKKKKRKKIRTKSGETLTERGVEKKGEREREKMYPSKQLDPGSCPFLDITGNDGTVDTRVPLHPAGPHR